MIGLRVLLVVILVGLGALSKDAFPRDTDMNLAGVKRIDGATNGDQVPYATKIGVLLQSFQSRHRRSLSESLSPRDVSFLDAMVQSEHSAVSAENQKFTRDFLSLCGVRNSMTPVEVAVEYDRLSLEFQKDREKRYKKSLSSLSEAGKTLLQQYVDEEVTPFIKTEISDTVSVAAARPDVFNQSFDGLCQIYSGSLPVDVLESEQEHSSSDGLRVGED